MDLDYPHTRILGILVRISLSFLVAGRRVAFYEVWRTTAEVDVVGVFFLEGKVEDKDSKALAKSQWDWKAWPSGRISITQVAKVGDREAKFRQWQDEIERPKAVSERNFIRLSLHSSNNGKDRSTQMACEGG